MKRKLLLVFVILLLLALAGFLVYHFTRPRTSDSELTLFGNIDIRQVDLAFNNNERIDSVLVQEGDRVRKGQTLAKLDESRLKPQVAQAEAERAAQAAVVDRLHNGSRPEEIAQGRANVDAATASLHNAQTLLNRLRTIAESETPGGVSKQQIDDAKAALDTAQARLEVSQRAFDLLVIGPRKEDIAQAEAQLQADDARVAFLRRQLADAVLIAPLDAVVQSRLMEPGDMASPQKPVFTLAITDPKWVRAYVAEPDLGKLHPGDRATVTVDSFPNRSFEGWVGFISPVAEFTPKPVQTEQLRTKLVYEVRVFVKDPSDDLRLGSPATAHFPLAPPPDKGKP